MLLSAGREPWWQSALAILGAVTLLLLPATPASQSIEPFVAMGVWYDGSATRGSDVPGDLRAIRSLGFNSVTLPIEWAAAEPIRGEYRFDDLERFLALSAASGLRVIVQLQSDTPPEWLAARYPDASPVSARGPARGYCLDHPGVRADLSAFVRAVSSRIAKHPSVHGLDLWRAPHLASGAADRAAAFCYCRYTQQRFREWLQKRYGTSESLGRAWSRIFRSWDEVEPPRGRTGSLAQSIDWATFAAVKLQDDLSVKAQAAAQGGIGPVRSHTSAPTVLASPGSAAGSPDDWLMSRVVDRFGTSIHPKQGDAPWSPVRLAFALDGIRSAARDAGWSLAELQSGSAAEAVTPADVRLWGWTALVRGARAICYASWARDGTTGPEGVPTARARVAGEVAGIISRNQALFAPLRPRPGKVAILYNPLSYVSDGSVPESDNPVSRSMAGFYRAMFDRNIPTDFIHADETAAGWAPRYRAVFIGHSSVLSQAAAQALRDYVKGGGTIISEGRPAAFDDRGHANPSVPGFGLDEVFGARETRIRTAARVDMILERDLEGPLAPLSGRTVPAVGPGEHLEVTSRGARVLARFPDEDGHPGDPAIVMSEHGGGRGILIGSFPSAAFELDPAAARTAGDLLAALAAIAGVTPDVRIEGGAGSVETRVLESPAAVVIVGINHAETPRKVTLTFPADTPEAVWQNMETGAAVNFVAGPEGPTYTHAFGPRDVFVLMIGRRLRLP